MGTSHGHFPRLKIQRAKPHLRCALMMSLLLITAHAEPHTDTSTLTGKVMCGYGMDGAFVQRFVAGVRDPKSLRQNNTVLAHCRELVEFFKKDGCTAMLGVPTHWRELKNDALADSALPAFPSHAAEASDSFDVVIYGGVPCGIAAAIAAAREGASVLLIEPTKHVGGLNTSGLNTAETEHMLKWTFGGVAREVYERIGRHYGKWEPAYYFESHIAEKVRLIFRTTFQRQPSAAELKLTEQFLASEATPAKTAETAPIAIGRAAELEAKLRKKAASSREKFTPLNALERHTQIFLLTNELIFVN